jgi:hypothetical protein
MARGGFEELADVEPLIDPEGNFSQHAKFLLWDFRNHI